MALVETGRSDEAFGLASLDLARADRSLTIARYRGYVAQLLGNSPAAVEAYQIVVAEVPDDWQSWNNLGNARLLSEDFDGAVAAFRESIKLSTQSIESSLNLARALEEIAEAGFWRIGLAGEAETDLKDALGPQRVALVLGAEGPGMRSNTREHCDALAKLPIRDTMESLNVSNAAAVALYAASVA